MIKGGLKSHTPSCSFLFLLLLSHHTAPSQVLIIEVNTVPGMTPSTVLIHQVWWTVLDYCCELFDPFVSSWSSLPLGLCMRWYLLETQWSRYGFHTKKMNIFNAKNINKKSPPRSTKIRAHLSWVRRSRRNRFIFTFVLSGFAYGHFLTCTCFPLTHLRHWPSNLLCILNDSSEPSLTCHQRSGSTQKE